MGKTVIEKILQSHSEGRTEPGKIVWVDLDVRSARDFGGPNVVKNFQREYGDAPVADKEKTFFTFDLSVPACTRKYAENQQICRKFARKQGIKVFDVDKGIGSHILMEEGLASPGKTVVGTDSHLNILGAVNCFSQGMGDVDITFAFKSGKIWFEVPETMKVQLEGQIRWPATAKDLTLCILKHMGTQKAALKAVEFYGEAVENLSLAGRITLCSMETEMAGITGFIPRGKRLSSEERKEFPRLSFSPLHAERGAHYSDECTIDVHNLNPQVAVPFSPTRVQSVSELKNIHVDSGFIGSCTNGRVEDFKAAAQVLKGRKVKPGIMLKLVPATRRVYERLLQEGILEILFESGAIVSNPGCGGCAEGHIGLTGSGEVQISTGNRNFAGKQGRGEIYLASPAVVAASCVKGRIASPEDV
ncbi:3-isopropylmalate dehydratase large subunit [bacterium]|nr:3-isopropylmalate dehydratase large subunit [bacterium]